MCRLLSQSGFYPLVSGLLPPPIPPFWRCVDLGVCLPLSMRLSKGYSLPIRSNRISWKFKLILLECVKFALPYLLGQIGLVGNLKQWQFALNAARPYLLGQIGLVGNSIARLRIKIFNCPYLLGQIGLVGNIQQIFKESFYLLPYLLGQIGLVGNTDPRPLGLGSFPYLLGQIGLVGNDLRDEHVPTLSPTSLPIRSNRISWKLCFVPL